MLTILGLKLTESILRVHILKLEKRVQEYKVQTDSCAIGERYARYKLRRLELDSASVQEELKSYSKELATYEQQSLNSCT